MTDLIRYDVVMPIYVRRYTVDTKSLVTLLRMARKAQKLTVAMIAARLMVPVTEVEHWFRTDKYQSVPSPNVWKDLKKLLDIRTDKFDQSIMTFMQVDGKYDMGNRVYDSNGIAPTLLCGEPSYNILIRKDKLCKEQTIQDYKS